MGNWNECIWSAGGAFRPEMGNWKEGGKWFFPEGIRGPHFHWGKGAGLQTHHLPWQASNWLNNFSGLAKRGQAGQDLLNLGKTGGGAAVAARGVSKGCGCD